MSDFKLDFAGIGIAKAGTTWLAACLAEHPAVCMATGKETNFFMKTHVASVLPLRTRFHIAHHEEGMAWFRGRFAHHRPGQIRGEYSNGYVGDPESARLLLEHNPGIKLICCFRNPVDVIYAGYFQLARIQPLPGSFEETLKQYPSFIEYGRYVRNLQPFLDRFPRENILFVVYDDIKPDAAAFYRRICEFLGVDAGFSPPSLMKRINPRTMVRSKRLRDLRFAINGFLQSTAATRLLRKGLSKARVGEMVLRLFQKNEKAAAAPPMTAETRAWLVRTYREDNERLGAFLGRDLSHWNR
jgi:hypothetical protein